MRTEVRIAFANMKHHKSKNILIGIAIFLTTMLLFLVPAIGKGMIDGQFAAVNEIYPTFHALYRNVNEETVTKLAAHHGIERYGLRGDAGTVAVEDADIAMIFLDEEGLSLYHMELAKGRLPEKENEIVVSQGILEELGQNGMIGDTVHVPYQIYRDGGLDLIQEKDFVISGLFADTEANREKRAYMAFVSKAFLEEELPSEQIFYRFLFRINGETMSTTDEIEWEIRALAEEFGIGESDIGINEDYLLANYIDPSFVPVLAVIMLIIVIAGIITVYSIYYVSMEDRIREFGKLKAIGATRRQLRRIVLGEGLSVALFAIPLGLIVGTVVAKFGFDIFLRILGEQNDMAEVISRLFAEKRFSVLHGWCYVLAILITVFTVYLSLRKPMKIASRVSAVEAMRYQGSDNGHKKQRKGCREIGILKLARIYLTGNRKKSLITVCSMGITGVFVMVVASVLSCADPAISASNSITGQYEILPAIEERNKEHPERAWSSIQQNNPLTEELRKELEQVDGVLRIESFTSIGVKEDIFRDAFGEEGVDILGVPESFREELEDGIVRGDATYDGLLGADSVIVDKDILRWCPDIEIGTVLHATVCDGDNTYEKDLTVAAIGDYTSGFINYCYLLMPKEAVESLGSYNLNKYFRVFAEENYNEKTEGRIKEIIAGSELLEMRSWKAEYDEWKIAMAMTGGACYAFLGVLSVICIMNMVNTMIHSVHIRRKEIGMLQAIGMSKKQLTKMLLAEGCFYTVGTLILSVGGGSALGYPVFLWAKEQGAFNISVYQYPVEAAFIVTAVLLLVQVALALILGKSVQKESMIDRIRFSD